jgi:Protein of unknown function (DUF1549)/Protein of unknown function (DUF1553)
MADALQHGGRSGRAFALVAALVLAGGILTRVTPAQVHATRPGADKKPAASKPAKPEAPRTRVITLPPDTDNDVREMSEVINTRLEKVWKENSITPAPAVSDYEFIRRASLDIIGRVAKPEEIQQYMRDPKDYRRTLLIDRLLKSPDYARHWANVWSNWLLSRAGQFGRGTYHTQMATWLEDQFARNRPHNEIVHDLITAKGKNTENGAVNFVLAHVGERSQRRDEGRFEMVPLTSRVTRLFLGIQTQCTQCHDHPFDANLKQNHFWGINVFLRQVSDAGTIPRRQQRRQTFPPLTLEDDANVNRDGIIQFEKRNGVFLETKALFFDKRVDLSKANNRREELARLVTEHDSFSRAMVNRMWGVFFGRGFVNPIDDFTEQNPVNHPELLAELSKMYKHYGYDTRKLIRWICNSEPYNLSIVANKTNDKQEHEVLFSRMMLKSMSPEQLFESMTVATGSEKDRDARREELDRWLRNLVSNFGDDEGNEVNFNGTIVQALMMMNDRDINAAISRKGGTVSKAVSRARYPAQVINELYLATLNRPPTPNELRTIIDKFRLRPQFMRKDAQNPAHRFEDLMWALLNSNEFLLNH